MIRGGWGFASGTFGELVQGELNGTPFLVTLPIRWGTRAIFIPRPGPGVEVYPPHRKKAQVAAQQVLKYLGKTHGGLLSVSSVIPIGKGMASSSADVVASMRAVSAALGKSISASRMARIAAHIEPSDGVMYDGVVAFNPRQGVILERWGPMPTGLIVGHVGQGRVNTEAHHRERIPYTKEHQKKLSLALNRAREGVIQRDFNLIGEAGRFSAEVQWERGSEDGILEAVLHQSRERRWGVVVAHSGTVRGFIFSPQAVRKGQALEAERYLQGLDGGSVFRFWTQSRKLPSQGPLEEEAIRPRRERS